MTVTTTFTIDKLETVNLANFQEYVIAVGYTITGTEGDNSYSMSVVDSVGNYDPENPPSVDPSTLIPYANLTEQQVRDWVVAQPAYAAYVSSVEQNEVFAPADPQPDEPALPW